MKLVFHLFCIFFLTDLSFDVNADCILPRSSDTVGSVTYYTILSGWVDFQDTEDPSCSIGTKGKIQCENDQSIEATCEGVIARNWNNNQFDGYKCCSGVECGNGKCVKGLCVCDVGWLLDQFDKCDKEVTTSTTTTTTTVPLGDQTTTIKDTPQTTTVVTTAANQIGGEAPATTTKAATAQTTKTVTAEPAAESVAKKQPNDVVSNQITNIMASLIPRTEQTAEPVDDTEHVQEKCNHFDAWRWSPPPQNPIDPTAPIPVKFAFEILQFKELDSRTELISLYASSILAWDINSCPRTSKVNKAGLLRVGNSTKVWTPPFVFLNGIAGGKVTSHHDFLVADNGGTSSKNRSFSFYTMHLAEYTARCHLHLERFPFDKQQCSLKFSLNRASNLIKISEPIFLAEGKVFESSEWKIEKSTFKVDEMEMAGITSSTITLTMDLQRDPGYYVDNIYKPTTALASLLLFSFFMPPTLIQRPLLTITIVLATTVAQGSVLGFVPMRSKPNMLSTYVNHLYWLSVASVMYHSTILWLAKSVFNEAGQNRPMPYLCNRRLSLIRLIDVFAFLIALLSFTYFNLCFFSII